jgi:hypothetical protein
MKLKTAAGFTVFLINSMLLLNPAEAKEQAKSNETCGTSPRPMRVTAKHIEPNGIGYHQGYTTLEGFFPYSGWDNWLVFLDARAHMFNDGRPAANAGLGVRYLTDTRVWGINAYYDYRKTHRQHYNQAAMGLEALGRIWDFRINGYLPVGEHKSRNYGLKFSRFKRHKAILSQKYEYVLGGFNAEVGAHVDTWKNFPLYFAAGPYYLTGRGGSTWGGQARASVKIYEYLELEGNGSYDHLFKWIGQGQISLNIPFGTRKQIKKRKAASCSDLMPLSERSYQSVDRFEIIPVDRAHHYSAAIDPATDKPYYFVFVNNTSSSEGTFESPYPTLADAQANSSPYNVIYVYPGDGTSNGMNTGITLSDFQRLWGSGVAQTLPTTLGNVTIPSMSNTSFEGVIISPIITNGNGAVVTLANGNEVSGFFLQSQGSYPSVSATNVINGNVLNSTLAGANAPGYIGIMGTGMTGTLNLSGCRFNDGTHGILLENSSGNLAVNIMNSTFSDLNTGDAAILWTLGNAAQGNLSLSGSSIVSSYNGVEVDISGTSAITAQLNNNNITAAWYGFYVNSSSGQTNINVVLQNNAIETYRNSVYLVQTGSASATLTGNKLFGFNNATAFELDSNAGSTTATVVVSENNMYANGVSCVYLHQFDGNLTANVNNNIIQADGAAGIYGFIPLTGMSQNGVSQVLSVEGNTINADGAGVEMMYGTGIVSAKLNNNTINGIGNSGSSIYLDLYNDSSAQLVINGNTLTSATNCIQVVKTSTANLDIIANNNTGVGDLGFLINNNAAGNTNLSMSGNAFGAYQPVFLILEDGNFNATFNGNTFTAAGDNALYCLATGAGFTSLNATGNTITSGGGTGSSGSAIYLLSGAGILSTSITDNVLNGVAFALDVTVYSGTMNMDLSNNSVTSGGGYYLSAPGGNSTWMVNGNNFAALSSAPVFTTITGGSLCMQLNNNTAYPIPGAYVLNNMGGTFILNPPQGNIGQLTTSGVVIQPCP